MIETVYIMVELRKVSVDLRGELLSIYPKGCRRSNDVLFCYHGWLQDAVATSIHRILTDAGLAPSPGVLRKNEHEFLMVIGRKYEPEELEQFSLFEAMGRTGSGFSLAARQPDGRLAIEPRFFKRKIFLEANCSPSLIVSRQVRNWIESSELRGMEFRPVDKEKGRGAADLDNLWELCATHVMPPMSPICTWFDDDGNSLAGDSTTGKILVEGLYQPPEFHYTADSLRSLPESDFFMTHESFSTGIKQEPALIISRRFCAFCQRSNLEIGRNPVRVDP